MFGPRYLVVLHHGRARVAPPVLTTTGKRITNDLATERYSRFQSVVRRRDSGSWHQDTAARVAARHYQISLAVSMGGSMPGHGSKPLRGLESTAQSSIQTAKFGRMFRWLEPAQSPKGEKEEREVEALLEQLAGLMVTAEFGENIKKGDLTPDAPIDTAEPSDENPEIPAGYTYLGQFIDHDITFDPASSLQQQNDPDALEDFRTPRFDLDSLYGSGPSDSPFLYESNNPANKGLKLLVGVNAANSEFEPHDLPRNQQGRALTGDPRNDENLIVSQLHLLFIRFHNKEVDRVRQHHPELTGGAVLEECQRVVRWHYQWIVVHDFLERIAGKATAQAVLKPGTATTPPTVDRQFFNWTNDPFMPVEFSGAAYRFGHSMIRPDYDLNEAILEIPIFAAAADPNPLEHLGGFRRLPFGWSVEW